MERVDKINDNKPCVFISYNSKDKLDKSIGNLLSRLQSTLAATGFEVVDDTKILGYNGSIYDFMQKQGLGKYIILILSKNYLQSKNCMLELNEIVRGTQSFSNRFFPLISSDVNIFSASERAKYIDYWKREIENLEETIKSTDDPLEKNKLLFHLNKYACFSNNLNHILEFLSSVNTLTFHNNAEDIINYLSKSLEVKTKIDSEHVKSHEPSY